MKKLLILVLASLFIFAACSLGNSKPKDPEQTPESTTVTQGTENGGGSTDPNSGEENNGTGGSGGEEGNTSGDENNTTRILASGKTGKYEKPYEVGDIVFKDGSATPYTEDLTLTDSEKKAVLAIIFYKGTGLNSDIYEGTDESGTVTWTTGDTTTVRTIGVGLRKDSYLWPWCAGDNRLHTATIIANAYSRNIKTIQCKDNYMSGSYTFTGDKNGSDNLSQIAAFLSAPGSGTTDDTRDENNYPAFYLYSKPWYIPSIAELYQIYVNGIGSTKIFDINKAIELCGGEQFVGGFWSSSQCPLLGNDYSACYLSIGYNWGEYNCFVQYQIKSEGFTLCVIREFD